jgi:Tfp pilus assembly protein PilF
MGNLERIKLLEQFSEEEPENPFNWYALALEYQESDPEKTNDLFDKLLLFHKSYLPTYFPAAHFFSEKGEFKKAEKVFRDGIRLAKSQKNEKAFRELQNSFQNFCFENDLDD